MRKIRRFIRDDRGAVAVLVAVMLVVLISLTAMAVDIGVVYSAKSELKNAADAATLGAANVLISWDDQGLAQAEPETAYLTAVQYSEANKALGVPLSMLPDDLTMGYWDPDLGDFDPDRTGPSADPDDLTGVRVKLRRDTEANSPVATYFAKIFGLNEVDVSAVSVAFLGWAGSAETGQIGLPIAVHAGAITGGDGPVCGTTLEFANQFNENASWTSFFIWPADDHMMRALADGTIDSPPLEVGDTINLNEGKLSQATFDSLYQRFQAEGTDTDGDGLADEWIVMLPVLSPGESATLGQVAGFAHMVITDVLLAPEKMVVGRLVCGMVADGSSTGGDNYGTRAATAVLVN